MEILRMVIENVSLWEVVLLLIVIYLMFRPDLINRISKFKVGDFEIELRELKREIQEGNEKIIELESELENEKRQFEELMDNFDPNAPLNQLASVRQTIKAQARNISEDDIFKKHLKKSARPEELYAVAVGIREKRPVSILPDLVSILDDLAGDPMLGGFRLNTVWTLTSAVHKILISCVKDGVEPFPSMDLLDKSEKALKKLNMNPKVLLDRPDDPMRGIRGPIKYSLSWITKAKEKTNKT